MASSSVVKFGLFGSAAKVEFWQEVGKLKLEEWRLDGGPREAVASWRGAPAAGMPPRLEFLPSSAAASSAEGSYYEAQGTLVMPNSIEEFGRVDKSAALVDALAAVVDAVESGAALRDPSLLVRFVGVVFADHKRHRFVHWFGFPALAAKPALTVAATPEPLDDGLKGQLRAAVQETFFAHHQRVPVCFAMMMVPAVATTTEGSVVRVRALVDYCFPAAAAAAKSSEEPPEYLCVVDGSGVPREPGWPVRNALYLAATRWPSLATITVLCLRDDVVAAKAPKAQSWAAESFKIGVHLPAAGCFSSLSKEDDRTDLLKARATGWEPNAQGRMGPRSAELAALTDPAELAAQAASLNLQLMRWRLLPMLDLDRLASLKCLVLGAGTLGCAVARGLVAWGVRSVTFVDNGTVSYSNPARQSLYTFHDCGKPKAAAAARALHMIAPSTASSPAHYRGVQMTIPMPGHALPTDAAGLQAAREDVATLDDLVATHDVVYLLTDTREARWLPTVLAKAKQKLLVNVALGLDTYLVMRHGVDDACGQGALAKLSWHCYEAGALAVELTVAVQHHPLGSRAGADGDTPTSVRAVDDDRPLGLLPHTIRGFLTHYSTMLPATKPFPHCTACSAAIIARYRGQGFDFVRAVAADPTVLEACTGLENLLQNVDIADVDIDDDEDDF